jgi:hypothetical protein
MLYTRNCILDEYPRRIARAFEPQKNIVRKIIRLADFPGTLAAFCRWP